MSINLYFYVEGQTEEKFAKEILFPHFANKGIFCHGPHLIGGRGGVRAYPPVRKEIECLLKQWKSRDFRLTTLVDLYGLPEDFPGRAQLSPGATGKEKAHAVAESWKQDINDRSGRFMPFVFSYEFETLVLSNPDSLLAAYPEKGKEVSALKSETALFNNPEEINDSSKTAPSKRILKHLPNYSKVVAGPVSVMETGLDEIRRRCPHFNEWMETMENL